METFDHFLSFAPEVLLKLFIAVLCGGAFGMERERLGKPAGLRTNILICVGSTLYTLMSLYISGNMQAGSTIIPDLRADVTRIASQIVVGIGFIGAGTIMREKGSVVGLTSAAMVWLMGAIGIFIGAGYVYMAITATIFAVGALLLLGKVERRILGKCTYSNLTLRFADDPSTRQSIMHILGKHDVALTDYTMQRDNGHLVLNLTCCTKHPAHARFLLPLQGLAGFVNSVG